MQDRALALMGKKLTAAQALEGKFSSEGLVTMAGEDANVEIALARSLVNRMNEGDAGRLWSRVSNPDGRNVEPAIAAKPMELPARRISLFDFIDDAQDESPVAKRQKQLKTCEPAATGSSSNPPEEYWLF